MKSGQQPKNSEHQMRCGGNNFVEDPRVWIDAIGVPRGVPVEFKAKSQIAAGFESDLCWWCTINKNIDWINYIYYNQQRFVNHTRDGLLALGEQTQATSQMAGQNRMALDMLLAEKGGVCTLFGDTCYTFIPNNSTSSIIHHSHDQTGNFVCRIEGKCRAWHVEHGLV